MNLNIGHWAPSMPTEDLDSFHEMLDRDQRSKEGYEQHLVDYWDAKCDTEWELYAQSRHNEG